MLIKVENGNIKPKDSRYFLESPETTLSHLYNIREMVTIVRVTIHKDTNRFTKTQTPQAQILRF